MALLQIRHEDGREFQVAEQAFTDLYEPFGFEPTGVVYAGSIHAYTDENVAAANEYEKSGFDPNQSYVTLEAASRQALADGDDERAKELANQSKKLYEVSKPVAVTTNPPDNDSPDATPDNTESSDETATKATVTENEPETAPKPPATNRKRS